MEYAVSNRRNILFTGDIADTQRPDSKSIAVLSDCITGMAAAGLQVFVIQGQHDMAVPPWPVAISDAVKHVDNTVFEACPGLNIFGLDYRCKPDLEPLVRAAPETANAMALHQMARQVFPMEGVWNFDAEWVPAHIRHVFMSDFHEPVQFEFNNGSGSAWYTGSTHMCKIDEPVDKSFLDVVPGAGGFTVTRVPLATRRVMSVNIDSAEHVSAAVDAIRAACAGNTCDLMPIIVVDYDVSVAGLEADLRHRLDGTDVYLWMKPRAIRIADAEDVIIPSSAPALTMPAMLERFAKSDSREYRFVMDLFDHGPQRALETVKAEIGLA